MRRASKPSAPAPAGTVKSLKITKVTRTRQTEGAVTKYGKGAPLDVAWELVDRNGGENALSIWSPRPGYFIVAPVKRGGAIKPPEPDCSGVYWEIEAS